MANEMKMIGVRIPEGSDLNIRFKTIADKTRSSYYELLEKWISQEEQASAEQSGQGAQTDNDELMERFAALEGRVKALEAAKRNSVSRIEGPKGEREKIEARDPGQGNPIKRILKLHAQGLSTRAIARQLTEEKIPTMTGGEIWNFGTIAKMIKKHSEKEDHG